MAYNLPTEALLPDFDDMDRLARAVATKRIEADQFKARLENAIAMCVRNAYLDNRYWINGKPPTQSFIDNVVKVVGNSPEDAEFLKALNTAYREAQREAEQTSNLLENMRDRIKAFQTVSSNRRQGLV